MRAVCLFAVATLACGTPLPEGAPPERSAPAATVEVLPPAILDAVQPVSWLVVRHHGISSEELKLFEGTLSEYHVRRIRERDLPATLLAREVPTFGWTERDALIVAPQVALAPGARYALASLGLGLLSELGVTATTPPVATRLWPPKGAVGGSERIVYCGLPFGLVASVETTLEPGDLPVRAWPGVDDLGLAPGSCLTLASLGRLPSGQTLQPPLDVAGFPLEPSPIMVGEPAQLDALPCAPEEQPLALGCARAFDDRLHVRTPAGPSLWALRSESASAVVAAQAGDTFVLHGLAPGSVHPLEASVRDLAGHHVVEAAAVSTLPPMDHVVLNEVLANPLGPEPGQEWIELANDGSSAVDLAGYLLSDSGGEVVLPSFVLAAGALVLLVREDFAESAGADVPPSAGTALVRLPALGKNGLSNSGEALLLRRPDGSTASTFPGLPKPKPGVSVARRRPDTPDDAIDGFGLHAAPGASPGAANHVAE